MPGDAQAFHGGGDPFTSLRTQGSGSQFATAFKNFLSGSGSQGSAYGTLINGETANTKQGVRSMVYRARVGARFLPKLGLVAATRLTLAGTAGYLGWKVYQYFAGGATTVNDLWIDWGSLGADVLINPDATPSTFNGGTSWEWGAAWFQKKSGTTDCGVVSADCWVLMLSPALNGYPGGPGYPSCYTCGIYISNGAVLGTETTNGYVYDHDVFYNAGVPIPYSIQGSSSASPWGLSWMMDRTIENFGVRTYGGVATTKQTVTETIGSTTGTKSRIILPDFALGSSLGVTSQDGTALSSPDVTTEYNVPSNAGETSGDISAALDALDNPCGRALVRHVSQPERYAWPADCITSPQEPAPSNVELMAPSIDGESFSSYLQAIRADGYTGTATRVQLAEGDGAVVPDLGPGAVVSVTSGSNLWETINWPLPLPTVAPSAPITITINPGTFPAPTEVGGDPYTLPQPQLGETAEQYRQRLRDLGHLGVIAIDTLTAGEMPAEPPTFAAREPVRIRVGAPTRTTVDLTLPWPDAPPVVTPDEAITIEKTPEDWGTRTGGDIPPPGFDPGGYTCTCPPIDFGPLMDVGESAKFPFGAFAWIEDVFDGLNGETAPVWSLDASVIGMGTWTLDAGASSGNVSIVRSYTDPVLQFMVIVGSVWWLATSIIGFGRGGIDAD